MSSLNNKFIGLSEAVIGNDEKEALCRVIDSNWLSTGHEVAEFEKEFAALHHKLDAVSVSSCTAGLHLLLLSLGVKPGDEVLVPSVTFIATINAVLYVGAKPVPVDCVSPYLPHMDLNDARAKLTKKTKAVMVMHYGGNLLNLKSWSDFCCEHNLVLIEDAAHAPGLSEVGVLSDGAAYSFFANKNMTSAEGGMIISRHESVLSKCRGLRAHCMSSPTLDRKKGHAYSYDVTGLGYNYRMDELRACVGRVQLAKLAERNAVRGQLSSIYYEYINLNFPELTLPFSSMNTSAHHLMTIVLPEYIDRSHVMKEMHAAGIQTSIHYPPYHKFSWHSNLFKNVSLPNTEFFCANTLTLPLFPLLKKEDVSRVLSSLRRIMDETVKHDDETRKPVICFAEMMNKAWELYSQENYAEAKHIFEQVEHESMTPHLATIGLLAIEGKLDGFDAVKPRLYCMLEKHPECTHIWKLLEQSVATDNYELAAIYAECAQDLEV